MRDLIARMADVSIHALLAECDPGSMLGRRVRRSFNPRTPCGVRPWVCEKMGGVDGFNPRTPCGVRLLLETRFLILVRFQSTHSLRSATREASRKSG